VESEEEAGSGEEDEPPKKKEDDDGVDPMMKYVSNILAEHQTERDRKKVLSIFEKWADSDSEEIIGVKTLS